MGGKSKKAKEVEPKNAHGVQFNLNVNSEDADVIREALINAGHVRLSETFETKRELSIMREVLSCDGSDIQQKIDKCIEAWSKGGYGVYEQDTREAKYNMKHRVLHEIKS